MSEFDDLDRRARRIVRTGEQVSASFARELARVWREAERQLRVLVERLTQAGPDGRVVGVAVRAAQAAALRDQVRQVLETAGYDTLIRAAAQTSSDAVVAAVLSAKTAAEVASLRQSVGPTLQALRALAASDLFQEGDEVATALTRALTQHLFSQRPVSAIVAELENGLDRAESEVTTLFDTQVSIYGRQVEQLATEDLGMAQPFMFLGPMDAKTRPFCARYVGRVLTRAQIEALDNGQLPNAFLTGGGYNCRHTWVAVESEELRALATTGEREPSIAADVRRVKKAKKAKK